MSTDKDEYRENRIAMQAVVDAYDAEERTMGWYYYLEEEISFPFQALCIRQKATSPLRKGSLYSVKGMADVEDCEGNMYVLVEFDGDALAVPLSQLEPADDEVDDESREAICDWHYWCERGYQF